MIFLFCVLCAFLWLTSYCGAHFADGIIEAYKYRARNDVVPDVELGDLFDPGHCPNVSIGKPVPGSDSQSILSCQFRCFSQSP